MEKVYNHKNHEEKTYSLWEKSGVFTPKVNKNKSAFTIIMPPPNANDPLHIGHARFVAIEDILIRYHRMKGDSTLWLPGSDHAGIETQYVFEKRLAKEGKSRFDYDRETLYKMIWDYVAKNTGAMESQLRKLGASCDWSRFKFTLDPEIIKIVYKTFKKLYEDNLIYRGKKLVNYCTKCGTGYSNLEINYIERKDPLYYMQYGPFTLATTRPETKFGDTAVAVNPKDKRYKKYIGDEIEVDSLVGKFKMKVVGDSAVDPDFGTGIIKVTPAHDPTDFEIGQRHGLEVKQVIGFDGRLNELAGKYQGLKVAEARTKVAEDLREKGLLVKVDNDYTHTIGVCYKCKTVIEPLPMEQWFMSVNPLAKKALAAIKTKDVKFANSRYEKIATHWLKNLKDWNISRQIVWGIRIPAFRCQKCLSWIVTDGSEPTECTDCGHRKLTQDTDTFDTWFSSGQWPYATLLSGKNAKFQMTNDKFEDANKDSDYNKFYPTSVMETAYDIIPFWVIRMIMLGLYATGKVPFKEVLIHGLVRDAEGQKISKSKGNVIDPIEMAEKYGADALRMGIIWGALVENDIALSEDNIRGQRNFANKVWNVARFVLSQQTTSNKQHPTKHKDDKWILAELKTTAEKVTKALDMYRLNEAAEELYDFVWKKFADVYIEKVKSRREDAQPTLELVLEHALKLLHPFMPFVTEVIWSMGFAKNKNDLLISSPWPI